jgi:hypothetical protein
MQTQTLFISSSKNGKADEQSAFVDLVFSLDTVPTAEWCGRLLGTATTALEKLDCPSGAPVPAALPQVHNAPNQPLVGGSASSGYGTLNAPVSQGRSSSANTLDLAALARLAAANHKSGAQALVSTSWTEFEAALGDSATSGNRLAELFSTALLDDVREGRFEQAGARLDRFLPLHDGIIGGDPRLATPSLVKLAVGDPDLAFFAITSKPDSGTPTRLGGLGFSG